MNPIFDPYFSESSCGFRPGRSAHDGVKQIRQYIRQGYKVAVDIDLSKFFDTVNHDVLMHRVSRRIKDKRVLNLIGKYLRAGVMENGRCLATPLGVPQGGPLSPLLANILLDDLDKELEKRGHRFVRYADDIILVKSLSAAERVMTSINRFLKRELRLFTGRSWGVSMEYRLHKLAEYVRGWMNYYGISEYYRPVPIVDEWLRRRIRMCFWKQWRYTRTKVSNLLKLGTFKRQAIMTALSRR